jgi:hypothetical protein
MKSTSICQANKLVKTEKQERKNDGGGMKNSGVGKKNRDEGKKKVPKLKN